MLVVAGFLVYWSYVRFLIDYQRFSIEERLLNRNGQVIFRAVDSRKYHSLKSMDEIAWSAAVLIHSKLWINHLIISGNREFAFGPFGRVFVLRCAGIDASEVEAVSSWHGSPHDYPFPNAPERIEEQSAE